MNKRTKLILGIVIGAVIIFSGALFGLAKFGIINLKGLADPLYGRVEITVDPTNTGGNISITQNGSGVALAGSYLSGNTYIFPSLAYGSYQYIFGMPGPNGQPCSGITKTLSHYSSTTRDTYPKFTCGGGGDTQQYWKLIGRVTSGGSTISGASISIAGKSAISNSSGNYSIDQIPIPQTNGTNDVDALKNQQITVAKSGYQDLTKKLSEIFSNFDSFVSTSPHTYNAIMTPTASLIDTFTFLGSIQDNKDNSYIEGTTVTISCGTSCSKGPWTATPSSGSPSGTIGEREYNYSKDINDIRNDSNISTLTVAIHKDGYYRDINGDNKDNGGAEEDISLTVNKNQIQTYIGSQTTYYLRQDLKLTQKQADKYRVVGAVRLKLDNSYMDNVHMSVEGDPFFERSDPNEDTTYESINIHPNYSLNFSKFVSGATGLKLKIDTNRFGYMLADTMNTTAAITLEFSEQNPHFVGTIDGFRILNYDFLVEINTSQLITDSTFVAYGSVTIPSGISDDSIKVTVSAPEIGFSKTVSLLENFCTEYTPLITNNDIKYIIPDIPIAKDSNVLYTIEISPVLIGTSPSRAVVKDQSDIFLTTSLVLNSQLNKKVIRTDFEYVGAASTEKAISFYDAVTGKEIDLKEEKPITESDGYTFNTLRLKYQVGGWVNSQSERLASDNTYIYSFSDQDISKAPRYYILFFESEHYTGGGLLSLSEDKVYLLPKNAQGDAFYCKAINGLKFCTPKALKDQIFTQSNIDNMKKYAALITYWRSKTNLFRGDAVYIEYNRPDEQNIIYFLPPFLLSNFTQGIEHFYQVVGREAYDTLSEGERALVHNIVYDLFYLSEYPKAKETDQPISSYNQWFYEFKPLKIEASSPYQSWLASNDDDFNIYFLWWLLRGDSFNQAIERASSLKLTDIEYRMKALDAFFQAKFHGIQRFGTTGSPTPTNDEFLKIMHDAGYFEINTTPYETITSGNTMQALSADQIASGVWLKENYDKLSKARKINIQISIQIQRIKNALSSFSSSSITTMRNAVAKINQQTTKILARFGIYVKNNSISGTIEDQDGMLPGMLVSYGGKSNISGKTGRYKITYIPEGSHKFVLTNPRINKTYNVYLPTLTIGKQEHRDNINVFFTVPKRQVKGQVMLNNKPLSNGKIIANNGFSTITINLNNQGKFNHWLKENQYSLTIKDSNNKTRKVTNPGLFGGNVSIWGNITKLNIVNKNIDSMIWVK